MDLPGIWHGKSERGDGVVGYRKPDCQFEEAAAIGAEFLSKYIEPAHVFAGRRFSEIIAGCQLFRRQCSGETAAIENASGDGADAVRFAHGQKACERPRLEQVEDELDDIHLPLFDNRE